MVVTRLKIKKLLAFGAIQLTSRNGATRREATVGDPVVRTAGRQFEEQK